jgi:predicted MPP superfamily phosphohydrolase
MRAPNHLPEIVIWLICLGLTALLWRRAGGRKWAAGALVIAAVWLTAGTAMTSIRIANHFPGWFIVGARAGSLVIAVWLVATCILVEFWRRIPEFNPERRRMLATVRAASFVAPAILFGAGYIQRDKLRLEQIDIPIPGLPKDLDGLRIVQVSDIHLSALVSESLLARAIDMANETRAHIALVTGDLISRSGDPLDTCLKQLARLRADAGVLGCLGNHEIYAQSQRYTTEAGARIGIKFLRQESRVLQFGNAKLNFAGVDYQLRNEPYLVGAEQLLVPGATNILLSHNPDVFPVAAKQGYDLTIAGHTHGGQINVEILHQNLNVARFYTPYVYGLYKRERSSIFVTRGIGTIGVPARIGAPPEVALIRLCAT